MLPKYKIGKENGSHYVFISIGEEVQEKHLVSTLSQAHNEAREHLVTFSTWYWTRELHKLHAAIGVLLDFSTKFYWAYWAITEEIPAAPLYTKFLCMEALLEGLSLDKCLSQVPILPCKSFTRQVANLGKDLRNSKDFNKLVTLSKQGMKAYYQLQLIKL